MKVDVENISSVKRKLTFTLDEAEVAKELGKVYNEVKRTAHVKGFRQGKAPKSVLDRYFKDSIHEMTSQNLVNETFKNYQDENEIKFLGEPDLDVPDLDPEKPLTFSVTLEVEPEPEITDYKGIEIEVEKPEYKDEMLDQYLDNQRDQFAVVKELEEERKPKDGDVLLIRLWQGDKKDEDEPPSIEAEFHPQRMKPEFYDTLKDMLPGNDSIIEMPGAGNEPSRKRLISLVAIKERVLPDLDDELAKDLGADTVDELKEKSRKEIEKNLELEYEHGVNLKILEKLSELNPFEIPPSALAAHAQSKIGRSDLSSLDSKVRDSLMQMFEMDIKGTYILDSISKSEGIEANEEQFEQKAIQLAEESGQSYDKVKAKYNEPHVKSNIMSMIRRELTLDFLRDKAIINIKPNNSEK